MSFKLSIGKLGISETPLYTNEAIVALPITDRTRLDQRYLFHALQNQDFSVFGDKAVKGLTLNLDKLNNIVLPLPRLLEQRRIAAILDSADAMRQKRQAAIAKLNELAQSVFYEMFGDPVKNEKGWDDSSTLGEWSEIVSGITKGRKPSGSPMREVPYMAVSNVQDQHLDLSVVKVIEATEDEICRYRLIENDLLLTEGGDPDKLGRGTLWANEINECIHQNHIFRVRITDPRRVNPFFLEWLIGSARGKKYFLKSAKQTTGIASINMGQLKNFPMLLPPIKLQDYFASRLSRINHIQTRLESALDHENRLFSSLQQKVFSGEA
jgi:type I restriction enzyme S subunit